MMSFVSVYDQISLKCFVLLAVSLSWDPVKKPLVSYPTAVLKQYLKDAGWESL